MREDYEFRMLEEYAPRLFSDGEGKRLSDFIRRIDISSDDPRFAKIGELARQLRSEERSLFYGWHIVRRYTQDEIAKADLFHLKPVARVAPEGDRCGTIYDESGACPKCGAGGTIAGGLFLSLTRLPKTSDIAMSIAGEIIVSQRFVDAFVSEKISGLSFHPLRKKRTPDFSSSGWYELEITNSGAEIIVPTVVGYAPFHLDAEGEYLCPRGDTIGLNLLSEIHVDSQSIGECDVITSRQYTGRRRGILRPQRHILASPKIYKLFNKYGLKGARFELAYLK